MGSLAAPQGDSKSIASPEIKTIKTLGWTWMDRMIQIVILCLFPIGIYFVIVISGLRSPADVIPRLVGIIAVLSVLDLLAESITSVRQVEIRPDGVVFSFLLHRERRAWAELEPSTVPPEHGGWYVLSHSRNGKRTSQRGFRLTLEQARALLTYPASPKWTLIPSVALSLGISRARTNPA